MSPCFLFSLLFLTFPFCWLLSLLSLLNFLFSCCPVLAPSLFLLPFSSTLFFFVHIFLFLCLPSSPLLSFFITVEVAFVDSYFHFNYSYFSLLVCLSFFSVLAFALSTLLSLLAYFCPSFSSFFSSYFSSCFFLLSSLLFLFSHRCSFCLLSCSALPHVVSFCLFSYFLSLCISFISSPFACFLLCLSSLSSVLLSFLVLLYTSFDHLLFISLFLLAHVCCTSLLSYSVLLLFWLLIFPSR